jgi:DNA repair ATPase RecN
MSASSTGGRNSPPSLVARLLLMVVLVFAPRANCSFLSPHPNSVSFRRVRIPVSRSLAGWASAAGAATFTGTLRSTAEPSQQVTGSPNALDTLTQDEGVLAESTRALSMNTKLLAPNSFELETLEKSTPVLLKSTQRNVNLNASKASAAMDVVKKPKSQIREIRSRYLAGVVNGATGVEGSGENIDDETIVIQFPDHCNLVAVTGETASGKSLLVARVIELITGSKGATTFLAPGHSNATAEIELCLTDPYLAMAELIFEKLDLDTSTLVATVDNEINRTGTLVLSRTLQLQAQTTSNAVSSIGSSNKSRLKSICTINGQVVTLKTLATVASPLLAVVDTPMAASALSKGSARTGILDTAVPPHCLLGVAQARQRYRTCRRQREALQAEIASRSALSASRIDSQDNIELLSHWIDELDAFQLRITNLCQNMGGQESDTDELSDVGQQLAASSWSDSATDGSSTFASSIYTLLIDFRDGLESLDEKIEATRNVAETLSALASVNSAATALERARKLLMTVSSSGSKLESAVENSHELLNDVESALTKCVKFVSDDDQGMLSILEATRANWPVSIETIDGILLDWKSLARKHGVIPAALPSCHMALIGERDGSDEARTKLPLAMAAEKDALAALQNECASLTVERERAATFLADAVSKRMPALGMSDSVFRVNLTREEPASDEGGVGVETADFVLVRTTDTSKRGALVNEVASSGEKARILLAIECALPGSIGVACSNAAIEEDLWDGLPPIAVVYDEIDAHVGGRAAVSMANLLVDQSRSSQIIAITHSPSVAAAADMHVVVQKGTVSNGGSTTRVSARVVGERDRRLELARMASGDLAAKEAEAFADALIRDGLERRRLG